MTSCLGSQLLPFVTSCECTICITSILTLEKQPLLCTAGDQQKQCTMYVASASTELSERGGKSNKQLFFYLHFLVIFVFMFFVFVFLLCFAFQKCIFFCTLQVSLLGNSVSHLNSIDSNFSTVKQLNVSFVKTSD